ncbi:hypothetical protein TWF173_004446 [Orbilia oligospora]|uniref:Nascent polypeptide-associated complex subunit alpha-like UBA domain-containing protein n=2 Tax=Orbilia oligospora TaxID=2813651 RepID=G1WXX0_ARTOA|nr:hypothetical protein AOL_s00004g130 [Orbilia oligospora ATCC 24927]KAF3078144.1 hypothetical protein TWF102_003796 [Orbilia oligospora]EGX54097.1 hypothetical protein AOL_s00004g130 [Orbilia oligospora ATCC 24927]KAF3081683.1 hypothetical protein TWF706_002045 [Orbilia oligospora]KAF3092329.1 hypothetical protein TWF103_011297 [Orbilia oligospora]KAF3119737.1 hypothetical protein TWF594_004600 [Orbilia oligospora]
MSDPTPDTEDVPQKPTNAEDAKTLKALSNLDTHSSLDDSSTPNASSNNATAEALAAGLSSLSVGTGKTADAGVKKVVVKVAAEDVAVIVEEMEVSKVKATELLRANGADLKQTLKAMISPSA